MLVGGAFNITVEDGINELSSLCADEIEIIGGARYKQIPQPRESLRQLLDAARVKLPNTLPGKGIVVTTKKKLQDRRVKN